MKLFASLLALGFASTSSARSATTQTSTMLRGRKVTHTRTVYPHHTEEGLKPENRNKPDQLIDPQHSKLRGKDNKEQQQEHPQDNSNKSYNSLRHSHHYGNRVDDHLGHHADHEKHFDEHSQVRHPEGGIQSNYQGHKQQEKQQYGNTLPQAQTKMSEKRKQHTDKSLYTLPTGLASHFNESLFDDLYAAPFDIYASAMGHDFEGDGAIPVFSVPSWHNATGVFSGFSTTADPLIFENAQFLLHWHDIEGASSVSSDTLQSFMADTNFHSSLIISKSFKDGSKANAFLGLVVSYYQYGALKNVLVPFGHLEDFFDDTSEQHLLDPETKHLEAEALHELLVEKRSNSSDFFHPALAHTKERREQLEDLEIVHFQKLYQLLIRRSFLFSYGYADCLLTEPDNLRECLSDTFYSVVKMETTVRGALDDQIISRLAEINETSHSNVQEACISFQGGIMGIGSCGSSIGSSVFMSSFASL